MGPKASILILEQGSSVAQVAGRSNVLPPQTKVHRQGRGPKAGRPYSLGQLATSRLGRYPSQWPSFEGPGGLAVGHSNQENRELASPLWLAGHGGHVGTVGLGACSQSWVSSNRHLRAWSLCASGRIWFRMPPSTLEVASVATIIGFTTVGGSCRITPPTAPVSPFCSWPLDATSQMV